MNIGILTYHRSYNYGAFIQACALSARLNEEPDIHAEIIDYTMEVAQRNYTMADWGFLKKMRHKDLYNFRTARNKAFDRGREKSGDLISKDSLISDDIRAFQEFVKGKYDIIIAGSDEIWKLDGERGFPTPYWLPGDLGCKKLSYAASSRSEWKDLPEEKREKIRSLLSEFEFISVRDQKTYDLVQAHTDGQKDIMLSCDPSFLYRFSVSSGSEKIRKKAGTGNNGKIIVVMCDDLPLADRILKELKGADTHLISVYRRHEGYINLSDLEPMEWLDLIANADLVLSSFFHGVCCSIVYNTPFFALGEPKKKSKLEDLLLGTELEDRYLPDPDNVNWKKILEGSPEKGDYSSFVQKMRSGFDEYLKRLLEL